jgi:hypothetical protein
MEGITEGLLLSMEQGKGGSHRFFKSNNRVYYKLIQALD